MIKKKTKKSKFKKCKCGTETMLWTCPNCNKDLMGKDVKKEVKKLEE